LLVIDCWIPDRVGKITLSGVCAQSGICRWRSRPRAKSQEL